MEPRTAGFFIAINQSNEVKTYITLFKKEGGFNIMKNKIIYRLIWLLMVAAFEVAYFYESVACVIFPVLFFAFWIVSGPAITGTYKRDTEVQK